MGNSEKKFQKIFPKKSEKIQHYIFCIISSRISILISLKNGFKEIIKLIFKFFLLSSNSVSFNSRYFVFNNISSFIT